MVHKALYAVNAALKMAIAGLIALKIADVIQNGRNNSKEHAKEEKKQEPVNNEQAITYDMESVVCPITMQTIEEPASTIYGHLFEMSAIRKWVRARGICPITQQPLLEK